MIFNNENKKVEIPLNLEPHTMKIGKATYIVSSSFSENIKGDVVNKLVRLIQNDAENNIEV